MNQFKPIFLNQEEIKYPRVADSQKCIRVSGKHNDLEEVGKDDYHHTFFEMLGNWSFGDYYKLDTIKMAWELLTQIWKLPKERLWVTVYENDDEAAELWLKFTDVQPDRILRFGEKYNFWEMGDTGPCGPCSEIHYYKGDNPKSQNPSLINSGDSDYIEIWNLVFIQYDRDKSGELNLLPKKHVDTGAGLERIVAILQGHKSNYATDLFMPIIQRVSELTNAVYQEQTGVAHRVIADHIRMLVFAIADGGMPSNEGRGYVIRRILRRAARFGRILNMHEPFIYLLVDDVIKCLGDVYPELIERREHIQRVIRAEEELFGKTLDRGLNVFAKLTSRLKGKHSVISGSDAFKLYDTYGFPLDLTQLLAEEQGFTVDIRGFNHQMEIQRERARENLLFKINYDDLKNSWIQVTEGEDSVFIGYKQYVCVAQIRRYLIDGEQVHVILDQTPFYAESGGQVGDQGFIYGKDFKIEIINTIKLNVSIVHIGRFIEGQFSENPEVQVEIDLDRRRKIQANHTATHLLHAALRSVLGGHVHQAGSLVAPEHLRFDLTHYAKIELTELQAIENLVNAKIRANIPLDINLQSYDEARRAGAMALFGEKYGDEVRVIAIEDYSKELCGGTHVDRTGDLGFFRIIAESSVAAGIRRIEAVTGEAAVFISQSDDQVLSELEKILSTTRLEISLKVTQLLDQVSVLEKAYEREKHVAIEFIIKQELERAPQIAELPYFLRTFEAKSLDELKLIADLVLENLKNGLTVLVTVTENRPQLVVAVSDHAIQKYGFNATEMVKPLGKLLGGGGGGRAHMATAGGRFPEKIPEMFNLVQELIRKKIEK
jgi:alanyl-tRNA synthetase